ncbi:hypothetical protein LEP1GSC161_2329 [Leptospira santarosai str. CBC1416]|uniref:Uncharacterized protein n=5 Tax=Leptospira santarosai TaxID=28183 RepID=M6V1Q9_9LEPT|nr:hypothetical protein LEP1GSC179_2074 [Leptospira santarosai str. MOR084]EKR90432.1 hypothetical protein LEP1GSC163_1751 [Leptospira santarosai str. CBC379]EKT88773.1 hypothetical protein LSS_00435 [Leptospira santarosai serovar Shermani str. LT 821]EMF92306.1 hypothetical protein LEP1GSC005_0361 [Leptospira santarosai str. ST188]EMJ46813.1 hypothetical protein LEP1GSC169_1923 [Leptospira santarosai str. HAI1349]EMM86661.1 hypothetical protein LEP1GSC039_3751 [Leptospira santarosai str. 2000
MKRCRKKRSRLKEGSGWSQLIEIVSEVNPISSKGNSLGANSKT